ncbi:MAG: adenylosuccinate lyase [Sulfurospirillaceae bacterium]|nr:adenylosuccinate lyase [Sulfurospirillaceae bacterium]MDD3463633.1 adenylosuccinate lyase [Sulfurospirillaceae bacterium]
MQISLSREMLAVTLQEDSKTFYFLQNLITKNFKKHIGRKNKTIIFNQPTELVQKRYFLKLLSKIYLKKNGNDEAKNVDIINNSLDKSIKISLLKSNQLLQQLIIKINIEDNYAIVFEMKSQNSLIVAYLKNYFKDHLVRYRPKNATVTVYTNSQQTSLLLEKLLLQKELLGCYIDFEYNMQDIQEYKKTFFKNGRQRGCRNSLFSLLEEYYALLECKKDDTFEEIRRKYLRLVKKYHPDMCANSNDRNLSENYIGKFQEIQNAYEMIKIHYSGAVKNIA